MVVPLIKSLGFVMQINLLIPPFLDLEEGRASKSLELEALSFLVKVDIDLNFGGKFREAESTDKIALALISQSLGKNILYRK